jgi:hypothetical protein
MARVDYDRVAADYLEGRALPAVGMESWRAAIAPWLPTGAGGPVLDLGAGTGQFAAAIAGWFGVGVVAVEPSSGMRRAARAMPTQGSPGSGDGPSGCRCGTEAVPWPGCRPWSTISTTSTGPPSTCWYSVRRPAGPSAPG